MSATALNHVILHVRRTARLHGVALLSDAQLLDEYIAHKSEAAFEAIVRRHGAMVLGVCRRILRNDADAEDAFQATFLVLVRKAIAIRSGSTLGNWLYGVAYNTALKAKAMNARRRAKEREAGAVPKSEATEEVWRAVQAQLDQELMDLPEKFRIPIVLCDLEGKPIKEAAHQLGWPQGTLASRLARGRALLAKRLREHGLVLSAGVLITVLAHGQAAASLPAPLLASTASVASLGPGAALSPHVIALAEGVLQAMFLTKLKSFVAIALIGLAFIGIGGSAITQGISAQDRPGVGLAPLQSGFAAQETNDPVKLKQEIERLRAELAKTRLELKQARYENIILKAQLELEKLQAESKKSGDPNKRPFTPYQTPVETVPMPMPGNPGKGPSKTGGAGAGFIPGPGLPPPGGIGMPPGGGSSGLPTGGFGLPPGVGPGGPPPMPAASGMGIAMMPPMASTKVNPLALSPGGRTAVLAKNSTLWMFELKDGAAEPKVLFRSEHPQPIRGLAFSPDGKSLISGSKDQVILWDAATGKQLRRISLAPRLLVSFRVDADGRRLFIQGGDGFEFHIDLSASAPAK